MIRKLVVVLLSGVFCLLGVTSALAVTYNEAPMLQVKVAAGELPPVEERLPEEPLVVEPLEEIGQYGGALRGSMWTGTGNENKEIYSSRAQAFFRLHSDRRTITPNMAKGWDFSEDLKTFTIYLRKGLRWSDGQPFTADDIMFTWEDIKLNKEIYPIVDARWQNLTEIEKVDDYEIRFKFTKPNPVVLAYFTNARYRIQPKHYLKKWHIKYNSEAEELAKEEGFDSWYQCFKAHCWGGGWQAANKDINLPSTMPWTLVEIGLDQRILERNPYYWKVDTEGNQLPYIDEQITMRAATIEAVRFMMLTGEIDFGGLWSGMDIYTVLKENAEKGNYSVFLWEGGCSSMVSVAFNITHEDPVLRKIFQDIRFRQAMSLAINREEMNQMFTYGKALTYKGKVLTTCSFYEPWMGEYYTQYDPQRANELLDEMDLKWDEKHEYRLRPDGKPLVARLDIDVAWITYSKWWETISDYWAEVGVKSPFKIVSRVWWERFIANEFDIVAGSLPRSSDFSIWRSATWGWSLPGCEDVTGAVLWWDWFASGGEKGEEPPEDIKELWDLAQELATFLLGTERFEEVGKELIARHNKNLWVIGTLGKLPIPIMVKNNIGNFPRKDGSVFTNVTQYWGVHAADTWFFKK